MLKVSQRLFMGFASVICLTIIVGVVGIYGMRELRLAGTRMYEQQVIGLEQLSRAVAACKQLRLDCRQVVISSFYDDPKGANDARKDFITNSENFEYWMSEWRKSAQANGNETLLQFCDRTLSLFKESYIPGAERLIELSLNDMPDHANKLEINVILASIVEVTGRMESLLMGMIDVESILAEQLNQNNLRLNDAYLITQCALLAATAAMAAFVALYITRSVATPINEAAAVLSEIAKGNLSARVNGNYAGDFKLMKDSVNTAAAGLSSYLTDKLQAERAAHEAEFAKLNAEEIVKTRMRFLANMSHEIRTPINGIIGFTELALDDSLIPHKTADYLTKIQMSADVLLSIVNDILDLSKIDAGELTLEEIPFDLHAVFSECETIVSHKAEEKGLMLYFYCECATGHKVIGDPAKLRQVLLNLLSNSIKFTKRGSVTVTSKCGEPDDGKIKIYFEVCDTGIGMTREQCKIVFDAFRQADSSTTRNYGGTGLGLPITKSLVEMMGGEIEVESTAKVGSKFYFTLEFKISDEKSVLPAASEVRAETKLSRPIFYGDVLVCEDNRTNQQVAKENLEKLGLNVEIAANGKVGLDMALEREAEQKPYKIILMDMHMPVMDGLTSTKLMIESGIKTPIVAMTANVMAADRERCMVHGMSDYISKPFKPQDLWTCLLKYINPVKTVDVSAKKAHSPDHLPSGAGGYSDEIDGDSGLESCAGNERLYHKLLSDFSREQTEVCDEIEKAAESDAEQAYRIAHTMKSVTGTIGAMRLSERFKALERSLDVDGKDYDKGLLNACRYELKRVLDRISALGLERGNDERAAADRLSPVGKDEALSVIEATRVCLEENSPLDEHQIKKVMVLSSYSDKTNTLISHIENYDFEPALEVLDKILAEIR